jgi:hypothetical protein
VEICTRDLPGKKGKKIDPIYEVVNKPSQMGYTEAVVLVAVSFFNLCPPVDATGRPPLVAYNVYPGPLNGCALSSSYLTADYTVSYVLRFTSNDRDGNFQWPSFENVQA